MNLTAPCQIVLVLVMLLLVTACTPDLGSTSEKTLTQTSTGTATQLIATRTPFATRQVSSTATSTVTPTAPVSLLGVQAEDLQGQKIQFWHPYQAEKEILLLDLITEFNKINPWGIQVLSESLAGLGELDEQVQRALQSDDLPDLLAAYNYEALNWDAQGARFVNQAMYLQDPLWGMTNAEVEAFYPAIWQQDVGPLGWQETGKRMGMPWFRNGLALFYNRTWARELGYQTIPETFEALQKQACAASQANRKDETQENDGSGGYMVSTSPSLLPTWILAFGGALTSREGDYQFNTPQAIQALESLRGLFDSGCAWTTPDAIPLQAAIDRKALFFTAEVTLLGDFDARLGQDDSADEWLVIPFPAITESPLVVYGPALWISYSTPEQQLATWLFVRWLVSPENQARWVAETGYLPTRADVAASLPAPGRLSQNWERILQWLPNASVEPAIASWRSLRWAMVDILEELLADDFDPQRVADLLMMFEELALEIEAGEFVP